MDSMKNQSIWFPFTQMKTADEPLKIVRAKDTVLYDEEGKEYIDANSSWWVNVHGHGNKHIGDAIYEQFQKLDHVLLAGVEHPKAKELADRILTKVDSSFTKVFFSDDGSTAVEVALKMVFQFWFNREEPKRRIIALDGAYHGDTFGAMSIGQRGYFNRPFEHLFFDVDFLDFPTELNQLEVLQNAKRLMETGEFAAIILEPLIQGSAGMRTYDLDFLEEVMTLAKRNNVKIIFDEVMTGWGRTGQLFTMDYLTQMPDIVCLSKGLTGGVLPLGLTVATDEIFNAFLDDEKSKALLHGHSFTGSAIACAAACASLDIFEKEETWQRISQIVQWHSGFKSKIHEHSAVFSVRQLGTILAVEINEKEQTGYFSTIRDQAYRYFLDHGILLRPLGNVLFLNPPYCITEEELAKCYAVIESFLDSLR
ncbi:MAG: adenosylmethionine--8-amino-7-oxononanoate transaminase [Bacteroidetes bacterium]|nr:adenosylmethionine--8-amino-7-oxononanoate transaminase [Bacteroidota bacterium]